MLLFLKDCSKIVGFSEKSWQKVQLWTVTFDRSASCDCHRACYSKVTNKANIGRDQKRKARVQKTLRTSFFSRPCEIRCSLYSLFLLFWVYHILTEVLSLAIWTNYTKPFNRSAANNLTSNVIDSSYSPKCKSLHPKSCSSCILTSLGLSPIKIAASYKKGL